MSDIDRIDDAFDLRLSGFLATVAGDTGAMASADQVIDRLLRRSRPDTTLRRVTLLVAIAGLLTVAVATAAFVGERRRAPLPLPAVVPTEPSTSPSLPTAGVLPQNGWIAYANARLGAPGSTSDLGLVSVDGRHLRVGSGASNGVGCPTFSPDGHTLAYRSRDELLFQAIETGGAVGQPRLIKAPGSACPVWSPTGGVVAVAEGSTIVLYRIDGSATRVVAPCSPGGTIDFPAVTPMALSSDGNRIALACPSGVEVVSVTGGQPLLLADRPSSSVSWSPDGSRVAFDGPSGSAWIDPTGGDGPIGPNEGIWIDQADGDLPMRINAAGRTPIWSPGGRQLAWEESGTSVVANPDGTGRREVGVTGAYGFGGWSPDGRMVLQMVDVGEAWDLIATDVTSGTSRTLLHAVPTGSARSFAGLLEISWQPVWSDR